MRDLLVAFATSSDPNFIIEAWIEKVTAATGSTNRSKKNISDYRSLKFQVRSRDDWDTINRAVRGLKLPPQPPRSACTQTKDKWQTTCANLKFACIQKAAMVLLC